MSWFTDSIMTKIDEQKKEKVTAPLTSDQQLMINNIMAAIDKNKDK